MNASEYLANKRVNVELILYINPQNIMHYGIRLRPWKQDGRRPMMILVQGLTLDDVLNNAARAYHRDKWVELDWSARPWHLEQPADITDLAEVEYDFLVEKYDGRAETLTDDLSDLPLPLSRITPPRRTRLA